MPRGEVVLVRCRFRRGGFPSELVFHIDAPGGGLLAGVAARGYCFDAERKPLDKQFGHEDEVAGHIVGVRIGDGDEPSTSRVYLPDSDVYEVEDDLLVRNGELAHAPLRP